MKIFIFIIFSVIYRKVDFFVSSFLQGIFQFKLNPYKKKVQEWRHGSSVPVLQLQSSEFKPHCHQNKQTNKQTKYVVSEFSLPLTKSKKRIPLGLYLV
jgi:hypothetical protein